MGLNQLENPSASLACQGQSRVPGPVQWCWGQSVVPGPVSGVSARASQWCQCQSVVPGPMVLGPVSDARANQWRQGQSVVPGPVSTGSSQRCSGPPVVLEPVSGASQWSPVESSGVQWSPVESVESAESAELADSVESLQWSQWSWRSHRWSGGCVNQKSSSKSMPPSEGTMAVGHASCLTA